MERPEPRPLAKILLATALLVLIATALALVPLACSSSSGKSREERATPEKLPVRVERLARRPHRHVARAVATVEAWRQVTLRAEAPGRILGLRHEVGDRVRKGDLLVRLNGSVAWRAYRTATVGIRQARVALNLARINLERARRLRRTGDIPQAQLDQAENAHDRAKAALAMARAQTAQAGQQLVNYWVRAPFAGTLAKRPVNVGDYLSPGSPVFTLVEMSRVKIVAGLDPAEGLLLKKGAAGTVEVATAGGRLTRKARVYLVRPLAEATTRRIELELEVTNEDRLLKPGMIAHVRLPVGAETPRLLVPADAVVELLGRHYVYVVRQHRARRLPVRLGVTTASRVEILPEGARPVRVGDQLVVAGVGRLIPDAPVRIVPDRERRAAMTTRASDR